MFNVTRRVSFAVAIALTVGWGAFFLLFLASSNTLLASQVADVGNSTPLPPGVKLNVQVDKRIYRGGDTILIAARNDSRLPIWVGKSASCGSAWWVVERLGNDGETWSPVQLTKAGCVPNGIDQFSPHSLKTDTWTALVPGSQIGEILVNAPTGTYRVSLPFLKGKLVTPADWAAKNLQESSSGQFTIQ